MASSTEQNPTIQFNGQNDFIKALEEVRKEYPEEAEKTLKSLMTRFRKDVVSKTPVGSSKKKKPSKHLVKRYRVSKLQYMSGAVWTEFSAAAPHFHLVERGFRRGSSFVPGKEMVKKTEKEYETKLPEAANAMYEKLMKRIGQ